MKVIEMDAREYAPETVRNIQEYLRNSKISRTHKIQLLLNNKVQELGKHPDNLMDSWLDIIISESKKTKLTQLFEDEAVPFEEKMNLFQIERVQKLGEESLAAGSATRFKDMWLRILQNPFESVGFKIDHKDTNVPPSFFENKKFEMSDRFIKPILTPEPSTEDKKRYQSTDFGIAKQTRKITYSDDMRIKALKTNILWGAFKINRHVTDFMDGKTLATERRSFLFGLFKPVVSGNLSEHRGQLIIDPYKLEQ